MNRCGLRTLAGCSILALAIAWAMPVTAQVPRAAETPTPVYGPDNPPEGISAEGWRSILQQIAESDFDARRAPAHEISAPLRLTNRAQDFEARFGSRGMSVGPRSGGADWSWGLALVAMGPAGAPLPVAAVEPIAVGNRVEYRRPNLTEWYVNDRRGVEHGFTIEAPPAAGAERLELLLELTGSLRGLVARDARGLTLQDDDRGTVLAYEGLHAYDSAGRTLAARMDLEPARAGGAQRLRIGVDVAGATYPVVVDPLISSQVKKVTASDAAANDNFGTSVSVDGDTMVVGAHLADDPAMDTGAAYVFERNHGGVADNWGQVKKLVASDAFEGDVFGISVSISGDTIVAGASTAAGGNAGSAYVFARNQGGVNNWGEVRKLVALDRAAGDHFGFSVSISGDTVVVGAYGDDDFGTDCGSVYVFKRNQGGADNWGEVKKLTAMDAAAGDNFGSSVSISMDTIVVGAYQNDDVGTNSGSAYLYARNHGGLPDTWGQVKKLTASDAAAGDLFGFSASISGDRVVVGAQSDDTPAGLDSGSAYLFERNHGGADNWGELKNLVAADGTADDHFGFSVSISGHAIVVGAQSDDTPAGTDSGSVYVFERNNDGVANSWGQVTKLTASDAAAGDRFGEFAAISADTVVVGAISDDTAPGANTGSAYVFTIAGCQWSQFAKIVAADTAANDRFGLSVSISGDTLVAGAHFDDDAADASGSAYVFERNAGGADHWGQVKKLTASDAAANDNFGASVSISGDTIVVAAYSDDVTGTDNGSAYVFERNTGGANNWGQVTKLFASDAAANDIFGSSVSIDGDTIAVGSYHDDGVGSNSGSAYLFERNYGGAFWGQVKKLTASDAAANDEFGWSVSISGYTVVVGASRDDDAGSDSGSAYVFARNQGGADNWGQVKKLTAADASSFHRFGGSVSISGDTVVVGAAADGSSPPGAAYVFERNHGGVADNWGQVKKLTAADGALADQFGSSVSISGDMVVVGAQEDDGAPGMSDSGSAYVFERNQGGANNWGQVKKLTAPDAAADDTFGYSVSISGETLVVGVPTDDTAVGSNAGSAHVFNFNCPVCGDGLAEIPEVCDDGAGNSDVIPDACRTNCTLPRCGDDVIDADEDCDDGVETAACDGNCTIVECGDGWVNGEAGEACEGGGESAACDADCTAAVCGDGTTNVTAGEACDDAGASATCDADCTLATDCAWDQFHETFAADAAASDSFGISVAISGDTVVVGAASDDTPAGANSGSAYVFDRNQGGAHNWGQVKKLVASDAAANDTFGYSVSISGDTVVVGAPSDDGVGANSGSVYVFERNHGGLNNWGQVKKLTAADAAANDNFGYSVSIIGDTVVVGAYLDDTPAGSDSGSAYVFERNEGSANNWGQVKKLAASDAAASDSFGNRVSIRGDTVVVAAYFDDGVGTNSGSAYVFERNTGGANNWGQVKKLTAADAAADDNFGASVSIDGDTIAVGSYHDDGVGTNSGSAYVFDRNTGGANNWGQVRKLIAADAATSDNFGVSVSVDWDTIVVGSYLDDVAGTNSGSAYAFGRNAGGANNWGQVRKLIAPDATEQDNFGVSVSIDGDTIVAGVNFDDTVAPSSGAVHLFNRSCPACGDGIVEPPESCDDAGASATCDADCTLSVCGDGARNSEAGEVCDDGNSLNGDGCAIGCSVGCDSSDVDKLVDASTVAGDRFGGSIAMSGDTVVVGASLDDGAGVNSGSVSVFERNAGGLDDWGQVKKLVASVALPGDQFGFSVAISGDTVVVGAAFDDAPAGADSGSAYVFERNHGGADHWGQVKKLVASVALPGDQFGFSVAISGDTVVVGAAFDDTPAGSDSGSAYVFERNHGGADNWGQVKQLTASDASVVDDFGAAVSISGNTVVVGARSGNGPSSRSGTAYVFERNHGGADNWGEVKRLTASDAATDDRFGWSVSISGDTVVVGVPLDDSEDSGSACLFERNQGGANNWGQVRKLHALDPGEYDDFGWSVSISGDTVVVGAHLDDGVGLDSGSAYLFERNYGGISNSWGQVQKLITSEGAVGDTFGYSVSISGTTVVVGAYADNTPAGADSGSAYVFERSCFGAPGQASSASDLRATRSGAIIDVTFTPACGATDHAAYIGVGPIVGSPSWFLSSCGLGVDGTASFDPGSLFPAEFYYFVIVGYDGDDEGSYGTMSGGVPRPESVDVGACRRPLGSPSCP